MITIDLKSDDSVIYLNRGMRKLTAAELPTDREIDAAAEALWFIQTGRSCRIAGSPRTWNTEPGIVRMGWRERAKAALIAARCVGP